MTRRENRALRLASVPAFFVFKSGRILSARLETIPLLFAWKFSRGRADYVPHPRAILCSTKGGQSLNYLRKFTNEPQNSPGPLRPGS